jgi:hypothetical protein
MDLTYFSLKFNALATTKEHQLVLPQVSRSDSHSWHTDRVSISQAHTKFLETARAITDESAQKTKEDAYRDVAAVSLAFPIMQTHPEILLVMTAWFRLLFDTDDEVEQLPENEAQLVLGRCVDLFHCPEHLRRSDSPFEDTTATSASWGKISRWTQAFFNHIAPLLPDQLFDDLSRTISKVWEAMVEETVLKNAQYLDEARYLDVRSRSIGVQPFFLLLEHTLDAPLERVDGGTNASTKRLDELKQSIGIVVGLQNDIIGLERDYGSGIRFNHVMLTSQDHSVKAVESALTGTVKLHNDTVQLIADRWTGMTSTSAPCSVVKDFGESLLGCIEPHVKWASAAQRYKCNR